MAAAITETSVDLQTGGEVTKGEVGVGVFVLVGVGPPGVEVGGVKVGLFIHQKLLLLDQSKELVHEVIS